MKFKLIIGAAGAVFVTSCMNHPAAIRARDERAAEQRAKEMAEFQEANGLENDPMICRRVQRTGTRFYTNDCRLQSQWNAARRAGQEGLNQIQRATGANAPGG